MKKSDHMRNSIVSLLLIITAFFALSANFDLDAEAYQKFDKRHGHENTESKIKTQLNKYYNYVHLQPEWDSYPLNLLFDVTTKWVRDYDSFQPKDKKPHQGAQQRINQLQYLEGKSYLEVKYDYIDCSYQWIHYARHGTDMITSHLDYVAGRQIDSDNFTSFSVVHGPDKKNMHELNDADKKYYSQFVPICTSKDQTSFDYGVRIDDKEMGFDVYFVPSIGERYNFHYNSTNFLHYGDEGCFGKNYQSYSGTCDVGKESGLLIVIPDELQRSLTKVTVKLKENTPNNSN